MIKNWTQELFGTRKPIIAMCHLLALPGEGRMMIALPCENAIELHGLDGSLVATYPVRAKDPAKAFEGQISAETVEPSAMGHRSAVERLVRQWRTGEPDLPAYEDEDEEPAR